MNPHMLCTLYQPRHGPTECQSVFLHDHIPLEMDVGAFNHVPSPYAWNTDLSSDEPAQHVVYTCTCIREYSSAPYIGF